MKTILQLMVTMLAISLSLAGTLLDQIKQDPDLSQVLTNLFRKKNEIKYYAQNAWRIYIYPPISIK